MKHSHDHSCLGTTKEDQHGSFVALLPLISFLLIFLGTGIYLTLHHQKHAFYQLPTPIAALPAVILAIYLGQDSLPKRVDDFIHGVGQNHIIAMCLIFLLAGAFAVVTQSIGSVSATVNLGLSFISLPYVVPGMFVLTGIIALAMGTSVGTIAAISPIAFGLAQVADINLPLMAGSVLSGAMFGDNLSLISDTTIAATRTQGCAMQEKFRANCRFALPAAFLAVIIFLVLAHPSKLHTIQTSALNIWLTLPYVTILVLAVMGGNVFVVLSAGITVAGVLGLYFEPNYTLNAFGQDIYQGFSNNQEIFLLSMLMGGLGHLLQQQGGLVFVKRQLMRLKLMQRHGGLSIAFVAMITNLFTANNTVAIIVVGELVKEIAGERGISPARAASLLDIFCCVMQGLLPYGFQILLLGAFFAVSPLSVVAHSIYPIILLFVVILSAITGLNRPEIDDSRF